MSLWSGVFATTLGGLCVLAVRKLTPKSIAALSGFSAGVMLAAAVFSLVQPAIDAMNERTSKVIAHASVAVSILVGAWVLALINRFMPHEHFVKGPEGKGTSRLSQAWLFVLAIALHNFPEGLAVGVASASASAELSNQVALAIALQNAPEGLVVAVSLIAQGYARKRAVLVAFLTGLVEPVGALIGVLFVQVASGGLPYALGFAAGAMLFVISDEIIPESHRGKDAALATHATLLGFSLMVLLNALGTS